MAIIGNIPYFQTNPSSLYMMHLHIKSIVDRYRICEMPRVHVTGARRNTKIMQQLK